MALSAQYTPQFTLREDPWTVKYAATADMKPGDLVQLANGLVGYVNGVQPIDYIDAAATNKVMVTVSLIGAGDVAKATGTTCADGAAIWYDTASGLAVTAPPAAGYYLGTARGAAVSGKLILRVNLNGINVTAADPASQFATVAAAGTDQDTAAQVLSTVVTVTASDGTKGVALPAAAAGRRCVVINTVAQILKVYGKKGTAAKIDGTAGSTAYSIAASKRVIFYSDGTDWYSILGA